MKTSMKSKFTHESRLAIAASRKANTDASYKANLEGRQLTTHEIANIRGMSPSGALKTLQELERRGLVERCGVRKHGANGGRPETVWRAA